MKPLTEPLEELFSRSKIVLLDLSQITPSTPQNENIEAFFEKEMQDGKNPRLPQNRQQFNNHMLKETGARYLIGRYGEDRVAMLADTPAGKEGRTTHMAIDIFCKDLESVAAPASGTVVRSGYEEGFGEYGNYIIFEPHDADYYIFFGHLANDRVPTGAVDQGQILAHLGDYMNNENGGWSRHLHLQILTELPEPNKTPPGYSSKSALLQNQKLYPDPMTYFPEWKLL